MQSREYYSSVTSHRPRRRSLLRAAPLALATGLLAPTLASCTRASERLDAESNAVPVVDLSSIAEVPEIAELVPQAIRERGELINGAALNYAPGEFVGSSGEAIGYDIDILAAVGAVLGLSTRTEAAVFAQIIPAVGSTYDVGISSFTINAERLEAVTMVSYFQAGISYAVKAGNPYDIHPDALCGRRVALQVGTYQEELSIERSQECRDAGEPAYDLLAYTSNSDAATNVAAWQGRHPDGRLPGHRLRHRPLPRHPRGDRRDRGVRAERHRRREGPARAGRSAARRPPAPHRLRPHGAHPRCMGQ